MNMDHDKQRSDLLPVAWIDLLLSQGTDLELAQLRALVARDPLAAIEFAETRQVVESFRSVRISPSKEYAQQMCRLVLRANLRCRSMRQQRPVWQRLSQLVAVAAVLVVALAVQATLRINDSAKANEQPVAGNPPVIEWLPPSALAKFYSAAALPDLARRSRTARLSAVGGGGAALRSSRCRKSARLLVASECRSRKTAGRLSSASSCRTASVVAS